MINNESEMHSMIRDTDQANKVNSSMALYDKADISLSTDSIFNFQEEEMKNMEQDSPDKKKNKITKLIKNTIEISTEAQ